MVDDIISMGHQAQGAAPVSPSSTNMAPTRSQTIEDTVEAPLTNPLAFHTTGWVVGPCAKPGQLPATYAAPC